MRRQLGSNIDLLPRVALGSGGRRWAGEGGKQAGIRRRRLRNAMLAGEARSNLDGLSRRFLELQWGAFASDRLKQPDEEQNCRSADASS